MSTPRKTKRPALGGKPIAYGWSFTWSGIALSRLRGLSVPPFFGTKKEAMAHISSAYLDPIPVAIVPVTRGKKKATAK